MSILELKDSYQNGRDSIGKDLIAPCLKECTLYRRGTGFFSSSSLRSYADILERFIEAEAKIEILASPVVSDRNVVRALEFNQNAEKRKITISKFSETILLTAIGFKLDPSRIDYQSRLLSYLIATGQLELRFAIPRYYDWPSEERANNGLYHVKMGYFNFGEKSQVAFDGSFNESLSGHTGNVDRAQVYRSWIDADFSRMQGIIKDIDSDWDGSNPHIEVLELSKSTIEIVKQLSPSRRPRRDEPTKPNPRPPEPDQPANEISDELWPHQRTAVKRFLEEKAGILEMATGTGKTRTALEIIRILINRKEIDSIIVCTYGTDLLDQWYDNLLSWQIEEESQISKRLRLFRQYDKHGDALSFTLDSENSVLLISNSDSVKLRQLLSSTSFNKDKTLIIHDEIHRFGSRQNVDLLKGLHLGFGYKLGLSATPEREYDDGTEFLKTEVGETIFEYPLQAAIEDGILCEFDYHTVFFELGKEDKKRRQNVYSRRAKAAKEGKPWTQERLYIELSRVIKTAVNKPKELECFLEQNSKLLSSSFIFVADREQGAEVCKVLNRFSTTYKTYYSGEDQKYLDLLSSGKIQALVSCERLNEGIDVRSLSTVILVSSSKAKLTTIQRIGRCLRKDPKVPNKRANIVDLVLLDDEDEANVDSERMEWLQEVSKSRRKDAT